MEDRYTKAVRIAARALEMYEDISGKLSAEEKFLLRARLVEQALRLLEQKEGREQ
jgi:DNA-directed RNA polymerase subunit K/omega